MSWWKLCPGHDKQASGLFHKRSSALWAVFMKRIPGQRTFYSLCSRVFVSLIKTIIYSYISLYSSPRDSFRSPSFASLNRKRKKSPFRIFFLKHEKSKAVIWNISYESYRTISKGIRIHSYTPLMRYPSEWYSGIAIIIDDPLWRYHVPWYVFTLYLEVY